jgi:hypothetical protein
MKKNDKKKYLSQDSRCPCSDSKQGPLQYKSGMLRLETTCGMRAVEVQLNVFSNERRR